MKKISEIIIVLWLILSLFSVLVTMNALVVKATNDPQWNPNGYYETPNDDWIIESIDVITWENAEIVVNGDLLIDGKLTLSNVTLQMNKTIDEKGWNITVDEDGEFNVINGSTITTDPITAAQSPDPYEFRIDGTALIENSTVEKMKDIPDTPADGIQIYSEDVEIANSTIRLGYGSGVWVDNGMVSITNSNIINNIHTGIILNSSSNNLIASSSVLNNYAGIRLSKSSNNNIIGNDVFSNSPSYGIIFEISSYNNITGNTISLNGDEGIYFIQSSNNNIIDNTISSNSGFFGGIWLREYNYNNKIMGNNISNNNYGIYIDSDSSNNNITGNTISSNNLEGIFSLFSLNNNIIGNNITSNVIYAFGDAGIFLQQTSHNTITGNNVKSNNEAGIYLYSSSNNTITSNNISSNNNDGIYLSSSNSNKIGMNSIVANSAGINLTSSSNSNLVTNNYLFNNTNYGLYMTSSDLNEIIDNNITSNKYGAYLDSTTDNNTLYHNNFDNKNINASDFGSDNKWDNGLEGNWWGDMGDYTDSDGNGICDSNYTGTNFVDNLPLANEDNDRVLVDDPWFWFIQSGVNFAEPGWTVYAISSTYLENVTIIKTLTVIGEDRSSTIIDARGNESVVLIDSTSYVNVSGFTVQNGTNGLRLNNSNYCVLEDNNAVDNTYGIYLGSVDYPSNFTTVLNNAINNNTRGLMLNSSSNNTISNNMIEFTTMEGILLTGNSNDNNIIGNNITDNDFGVNVSNSYNIVIENNNILFNYQGILSDYSSLVIVYNNISYNYYEGIGNMNYSDTYIGNNTITYNTCTGIAETHYSNATIDNNTISYNEVGIICGESSPVITYNNITFNTFGIESTDGSNATVHWNNIHNNSLMNMTNWDSTILINAENNYWGGDPPNGISLYIDYDPYLLVPVEDAGPQ
jgi:parallel beta-helix repeat protein